MSEVLQAAAGPNSPPVRSPAGKARILAAKVPGFRGYETPDLLRESDALLREALRSRLFTLKQPLVRLSRDLTQAQRMDVLAEVDRLQRRLEEEMARLRSGRNGRANDGFTAGDLARLYAFDADLHRRLDLIEEAMRAMQSNGDPSHARYHCRKIETTFDAFRQDLDARERLVTGASRSGALPSDASYSGGAHSV